MDFYLHKNIEQSDLVGKGFNSLIFRTFCKFFDLFEYRNFNL